MALLALFLIINLIKFTLFVFSLFDKVSVSMNIDMEILIQFNHAFECPSLLFHRRLGDGKTIGNFQIPILLVILFVFIKAINDFALRKNFVGKLFHIERVFLLEELYRPIQQIGLIRLLYIKLLRQLFRYKIFA